MNAFAGQRIQIGWQRCGQGFTFTGTHFSDAAVVQHHAADQLHVEVTHAEHTFTRFTHGRERFRDQAFQRFAFFQALAELIGFRFQFIVRELLKIGLHLIDDVHHFAHTAQRTIVTATKNLGQYFA